MSEETSKPPPDYSRMYRDLDAADPKWRDRIEEKTGHRPGEPVTPVSPKEKTENKVAATPQVDQPKPDNGKVGQPNEATKAPASKVGQQATDERKVGEVAPKPTPKPADAKPESDDFRVRARILAQDQAKQKAVQDLKQKGETARKDAAITSGKPLPPAPKPQPIKTKSFAERVSAQPSTVGRAPTPAATQTTWAQKVQTQPTKPPTATPPTQGKTWAERVSPRPQQTSAPSTPKPPTPKPPTPRPPTVRRGR